MSSRKSSNPRRKWIINLLALAGSLFILDGGLIAYPLIRDSLTPPPAAFGEAAPPVLPTVTPLPNEDAVVTPLPKTPSASVATPDLLPDTSIETGPDQSAQSPSTAESVTPAPSKNVPTRIVIPAIKLDAPIETVGWSVVQGASVWDIPHHFAAGWLKTSAPLGTVGNTVLDGHHNTGGEVFRYLVNLKEGDLIEAYADDQVFMYEVTSLHILPDRDQPIAVRRQNALWIAPTLDERLTLVTCWPYTTNTHRLIVVAKPIGSP